MSSGNADMFVSLFLVPSATVAFDFQLLSILYLGILVARLGYLLIRL